MPFMWRASHSVLCAFSCQWNVYTSMTHPYSIYIWQPSRKANEVGDWIEPVQAYTQEYALYVANLIHQDTKSVMKVVRYGHTIAAYPNAETVERIESYNARWIKPPDHC